MTGRSVITGVRITAAAGGAALTTTGGSSSSWPDATNTGVPAGTSLTTSSGDFFTSANNQIVDALDITGALVVNHTGVLVKRCRITKSNDNIVAPLAASCTIQDCEINGNLTGSTGILMQNNVQCYRLNIHGCENGGAVSVNAGRIQDSWIHDLSLEGAGFHTDGLQFDTDASNLTIEHCNFEPIPSHIRNATSCINVFNDPGGTNSNITINNNRIDGRGCASACYFPRFSGWSNIVVTNNRMLPGDNGYSDTGTNTTTWSGNVNDLTSATVSPGD